MTEARSKFAMNAKLLTPTKISLTERANTPSKPTRDTEPDDINRRVQTLQGLLLLVNTISRKQPCGYAFNAIFDVADENDCLYPKTEDSLILTTDEKQEWENMISSNGFPSLALMAGCLFNRLQNEKLRQSSIFEEVKDRYFVYKDEREEQSSTLNQTVGRLLNKKLAIGFQSIKSMKGDRKTESLNLKLIVQFSKIINRALQNNFKIIYKQFFQSLKQARRLEKEKTLNTVTIQGNAIFKILKPKKQLDLKSAYFKWFLKSGPGERQIAKVADQLALYDKINYQTAGWRLFRLKPKKVVVNLALKRKTMLMNQLLKKIYLQRLGNSLNKILLSGFESKKSDVIRRIMVMSLRKQYLGFNIWHRKILKYQISSHQTQRISKINDYFSNMANDVLSSLKNSFKAFKDDLQFGQKRKVDAIQQIVSSKNGDLQKRILMWKNQTQILKIQRDSSQVIKAFETINNKIMSNVQPIFSSSNAVYKNNKKEALNKLFDKIGGRRLDALNIWRSKVRDEKIMSQINQKQLAHQKKLKEIHLKSLLQTINEMKRQKLIQTMKQFRDNEERNKRLKNVLQRIIQSRFQSLRAAFKNFNDLRLTKKGPFSNQQKVVSSIKLESLLSLITSKRIKQTFSSFTDSLEEANNYKYRSMMRLIQVTNEMRKRMYNRWSKIIIQDQNTNKNKNLNNAFELLFGTIRGLTSNVIYHNNERRKKQHALVRIFRNLMLNESLAFQTWNKITVERLLVKEKKGKKKYLQAMKMVIGLDLLFKNMQKDAFDRIIQHEEKRKAITSSRGAVFYNGLIFLIKYNLRQTFRKFTECTEIASFKKLKLWFVMKEYELLNRQKALTMWRLSKPSNSNSEQKGQESESIETHGILRSTNTRTTTSTSPTGTSTTTTLRHRVIFESRRQDYDD